MAAEWMLYGANGYTGRRIAEEAVRRGLRPVLAGRNRQAIEPLAHRLECPVRYFDLTDPTDVAGHLTGMRAVLHCAGPFAVTSPPMVEACLAAGCHYLDITGEVEVIEAVATRDNSARSAGMALLPAVGFDVVPSDCLATMLAARLPGAHQLRLAFSGTGQVSDGTAKTMLRALGAPGWVRRNDRLEREPLAVRTRNVPFPSGQRLAASVPWGDVASAWYSTRIPNIEVYVAMSRVQIAVTRRIGWIAPLLQRLPEALAVGIVRRMMAERDGAERPAEFWGMVADDGGRSVEATMTTLPGYDLTVQTALASLEAALAKHPCGFLTPAQAFGMDFILGISGTRIHWHGAH